MAQSRHGEFDSDPTSVRLRRPVVAGRFYPRDAAALRAEIERCFLHDLGPGRLPGREANPAGGRPVGLLSPHAGYTYSGPPAARGFFELAKYEAPETAVILGPNHTGRGPALSVWTGGVWQTPLGEVAIDEEFASALQQLVPRLEADTEAHREEHCIEVQLPFLQYVFTQPVPVVPIVLRTHDRTILGQLASAIAEVAGDRMVLVIASSDMSHYLPQRTAERLDKLALEQVVAMNADALLDVVERRDISMCGAAPAAVMLTATQAMGAEETELVAYSTSGDILRDDSSVVGYGSAVVRLPETAEPQPGVPVLNLNSDPTSDR